jgi:hypothetical protein
MVFIVAAASLVCSKPQRRHASTWGGEDPIEIKA